MILDALALRFSEYRHLYGVTALTERQVAAYVTQYFGLLDPAFTPAVLDASGRLIAFAVAMPSLSRALQKAGDGCSP